jgi:hypothetical protein
MKTFSTQDYENESQENDNIQAANAVTQLSVQQETLKALVDLQKQLQSLTNEVKGTSRPSKNRLKRLPMILPTKDQSLIITVGHTVHATTTPMHAPAELRDTKRMPPETQKWGVQRDSVTDVHPL